MPLTSIANLLPGKLFASRSVGNLYRAGDLNAQTVLSYAVEHLLVKHILVVGHTACGACAAAIATPTDHEKRASSSYYDTASERITVSGSHDDVRAYADLGLTGMDCANPPSLSLEHQPDRCGFPSAVRGPGYPLTRARGACLRRCHRGERHEQRQKRGCRPRHPQGEWREGPLKRLCLISVAQMWATWRLEHAAGNDPAVDNAASDLATTVTSASAGAAATDVVSTRCASPSHSGMFCTDPVGQSPSAPRTAPPLLSSGFTGLSSMSPPATFATWATLWAPKIFPSPLKTISHTRLT